MAAPNLGNGPVGEREGWPQRTIYIGLGGTGKDILLRIRRWTYEKWRVPSLPFTRFIWVDTDTNGTVPAGIDDQITSKLMFSNAERVGIGMSIKEVQNYFDQAPMDSLPPDAIRVQNWLDPSLKTYAQALNNGAGQIRSLGRLAFWHHASEFERCLGQAIQALRTTDALQEPAKKLGFEGVGNDFKIVVVAGIAGGTGSGTFIDAGVFARHLTKQIPINTDAKMIAVLMLPSVFEHLQLGASADKQVLAANGYAALKELDYLLLPRSAGTVIERYAFPRAKGLVNVEAPIYETVFLADGEKADGTLFEAKDEPFRIVADSLCMELDRSDFAREARSMLSNKSQDTAEPVTLPVRSLSSGRAPLYMLRVHNRYAAFGQAQFVVDRDRLRNAAAFRLGARIIQFMAQSLDGRNLKQTLLSQIREAGHAGLTAAGIRALLMRDSQGRDMLARWADFITLQTASVDKELDTAISAVVDDNDPLAGLKRVGDCVARANGAYQAIGVNVRGLIEAPDRGEFSDKKANSAGKVDVGRPGYLYSKGATANQGEDLRAIRENVAGAVRDLKERIDRLFLALLTEPTENGVGAAELLVSLLAEEVEALRKDRQNTEPVTAPTLPNIASGDGISNARHRLDEARLLPSFIYPFRGIAEKAAKRGLSSAVSVGLEPARRDVRTFKEGWRRTIMSGVAKRYEEVAQDGFDKILLELGRWLGEEKKISKEGDGVVIAATGMRLRLDRYRSCMDSLGQRQDAMANAFRKANRGNRNEIFDLEYPENDLLFNICLLDAESSDDDLRRDALVKAMRNFFDHAEFIGKDTRQKLRDAADSYTFEAVAEGMKEIVRRAEQSEDNKQEWLEVEARLENFCFDATKKIQERTQMNAFQRLQQKDDHARQDIVRRVYDNAQPLLRLSVDWHVLEYKKQCAIGSARADELPLHAMIEQAGAGPADNVRFHATSRGSTFIFREFWKLPIVMVAALQAMKDQYSLELEVDPTRPLLRHSDKKWRKFPDIVINPKEDYWQQHHECLKSFLRAVLVGSVRYNDAHASWTMEVVRDYRSMEIHIGVSIDAAIETLGKSASERSRLDESVRAKVDRIASPNNMDGIARLAAAAFHLKTQVYPQSGELVETIQSPEGRAAGVIFGEFFVAGLGRALNIAEIEFKKETLPPKIMERVEAALTELDEVAYLDHRMVAKFKRIVD